MKSFKVWAKYTSYCYLDVEAEDADEAMEIAEETDGGEYTPTPEGDWEIIEVLEE